MFKNLKINLLALVFFCSCFFKANAQNYDIYRDYIESFEVQPASARAAAMGFAQVANGGTIAEARINPASIAIIPKKLQTEFSYGWPTFLDKKSGSSFIGAAYRVTPKLSVGLSRFGFSVKKPVFGILYPNGGIFSPTKTTETFYTGTASYQIIPGLYAGINVNFFGRNIQGGGTNEHTFFGDAGVLYEKKLGKAKSKNILSRVLHLGASFTNVNMAKVKEVIPNETADLTLTSHVYAGASYSTSIDVSDVVYGKSKLVAPDARTIDLLFQFQFIDFLNMRLISPDKVPHDKQAILSGESVGAEILILKLVALRFGYRYEKRAGDKTPFGRTTNATYPYVKGFTFGTGLNIPLYHLSDSRVPFDLSFDYVHRRPFTWLKPGVPLTELPTSNINLRLNWYLK